MKKAIAAISVGMILAMPISAAVSAQQSAQQLVVPGRSIGRVSLGMSRTEVWKHLGNPTEIHFLHFAGRSYTWDYWDSEHTGKRECVTSCRNRVVQIVRDTTDEEHRRNLFSSIRRQYPHLTVTLYDFQNEVGSVLVVDDTRKGIAWELFLHPVDDFNMHLFNDVGPDKVIIHKAGRIDLPNAGEKLNAHNPLMNDIRAWFAAKTAHTERGVRA